jgi:hypothetical protein
MAVWTAQNHGSVQLRWATRRAGAHWSGSHALDSWKQPALDYYTAYRKGRPQLTQAAGGRVTALWINGGKRLLTATWNPARGWDPPSFLSPRGMVVDNPRITSNSAGQVAASWQQADRGEPRHPNIAMASVYRDGGWLTRRLGRSANTSGYDTYPVALGMDDAGDVSAAWEHTFGDADASSLTGRLDAGSATWEKHNWGSWGHWWSALPMGLAVQPDGAVLVNTKVPQPAPFTELSTYPMPPDAQDLRLFALKSGELVGLAYDRHSVLLSVHAIGGDWSTPTVIYTNPSRVVQSYQATMSPTGQVTALVVSAQPRFIRRKPLQVVAVTHLVSP